MPTHRELRMLRVERLHRAADYRRIHTFDQEAEGGSGVELLPLPHWRNHCVSSVADRFHVRLALYRHTEI